jgi:hypothetical protein
VTHGVDLRLQIREALLKSDVVRLRANHVRASYTKRCATPTADL